LKKLAKIFVLLSFLGSMVYLGCDNEALQKPTSEPVSPENISIQDQLDNASDGDSITLNSLSSEKSIVINKALSVDGNGLEGLTIQISSEVSNNVKLKNFKNATLQITDNSDKSNRSAGNDNEAVKSDDSELGGFKKCIDNALPLFLEDCTIKSLETEENIAIYLEGNSKKSEIEELTIKEGVESFSFIENDKDISDSDKSSVEKFNIENGVKDINLIGGSFESVSFADDISEDINFNYDAAYNQFDDSLLSEIKEKECIEAKDIALAENTEEEEKNGIYKFEITREAFDSLNGSFDILFLTEEQVKAITSYEDILDYAATMTYESPAYDMSVMGPFCVEKNSEDSVENGLHAIYGSAPSYYDYEQYTILDYKEVFLDKYMSYSKEAVVFDVGEESVTLYINKNAIKKSDLIICTGFSDNELDEDGNLIIGKAEGGSKLSEIDLADYQPYLGVNTSAFGSSNLEELITNQSPITQNIIYAPTGFHKQSFDRSYILYETNESESDYPDVENISYPDISLPVHPLTVNYYDSSLNFVSSEKSFKENISPISDKYEYYLDSAFENHIYGDYTVNWDCIFNENNLSEEDELTIYARPKRNITIISCSSNKILEEGDDGYEVLSLEPLRFSEDGIFFYEKVLIYSSYDEKTETFSNPITKASQIQDNSTLYLLYPNLEVYTVDKDDPTIIYSLGNIEFRKISGNINSPEFELYSSQDLNSDSKINSQEKLNKLEAGTKVYTTGPAVHVYSDIYAEYEDFESIMYPKFKKSVLEGEVYYYLSWNSSTMTSENKELNKDSIAEYEALNEFNLLSVNVYKNLPDQSKIIIYDLQSDTTSEYSKNDLKNLEIQADEKYFADKEKTRELTKEDFSKLSDGDTIYLFYKIIKYLQFDDMESGTKEIRLSEFIQGYSDYQKYKDDNFSEEYTEEELWQIEDGTIVYIKNSEASLITSVNIFSVDKDDTSLAYSLGTVNPYEDHFITYMESLEIYTSQDLTEDSRLRSYEDLVNKILPKTILYTPSPRVQIRNEFFEDKERICYAKFKKSVLDGTSYYDDSNNQINKDNIEEYEKDKDFLYHDFYVYDSIPGATITVNWVQDNYTYEMSKKDLLSYEFARDEKIYADAEKTKELSKEDLSKLSNGDSIYIFHNTVKIKDYANLETAAEEDNYYYLF